jgi:hypothetical protein
MPDFYFGMSQIARDEAVALNIATAAELDFQASVADGAASAGIFAASQKRYVTLAHAAGAPYYRFGSR